LGDGVVQTIRPLTSLLHSRVGSRLATVRARSPARLCGFAFTNELVRDVFVGFAQMREPARAAKADNAGPMETRVKQVMASG
jgi:hypothetical protein